MTYALPIPPSPSAGRRWGGRFVLLMRSMLGGGATGRGDAGSFAAERSEGPPAINELYHARRLGLVRMAILMVDDLQTAEDIVQDVFAALYRRHGADLRTIENPHSYLTRGVMNAAKSALRRRRTARAYRPPEEGAAPAAEDLVLLGESERHVIAALRKLTHRQRQVMVLRYWSGLNEQEIADTLHVSRGTVKSTASRALVVLRELLGVIR